MRRVHRRAPTAVAVAAAVLVVCAPFARTTPAAAPAAAATAVRDPAWSPDGTALAITIHDRVHVAAADGRHAVPVARWSDAGGDAVERDPVYAPDGQRIAFAADHGDGFDLYVVAARGGSPRRLTSTSGDERWPSWSPDGRIVFAQRVRERWHLAIVEPDDPAVGATPPRILDITDGPDDEREPVVSPDGNRVAFVSTQGNEDGDTDLFVMPMPVRDGPITAQGAVPRRVTRVRGLEGRASWAPDGTRLAFTAERDGVGSIWVATVDRDDDAPPRDARTRPLAPPQLISRMAGQPAWSRDGKTILVADLPDAAPGYNGEPRRDAREGAPVFDVSAFRLRILPAPAPIDEGTRTLAVVPETSSTRYASAFDRTWSLLRSLYYSTGPSADAWTALRGEWRPKAIAAANDAAFEVAVDEMIARQPLAKAEESGSAVVVSGHRIASQIGSDVLRNGGNVVDAAVAVSFALGVVEPDASGVGGDGMAIVWLVGMAKPVVVDFKDQTPMRATLDNPRIFRDGRLVADGPAAANIPGVVAGMDLLFRRFGSGKVEWASLIEPSAEVADRGFVLDGALPASLDEGRGFLARYPEAARVFLPLGRPPRPGERFVNPDLARTLRTIATDGAESFYRGALARRIAADMAAHGGIMTAEDLAQYRAIEREGLEGRYRGRTIVSAPPPVSSGAQLIETLQILDRYPMPPGTTLAGNADALHHAIEAWKAREPIRRIADPALWPIDLGDHLTAAQADRRFALIARDRAMAFPDAPDGPDAQPASDRIGRGTTSFVVADARGNVIAITQTLSTWGGNFYVSDGLGFLYNNHLRSNRTTAGAYGQMLPLMRSSSTSVPTLVFEGDGATRRPVAAVACAGNAWITASVYSILSAVIDGGLSAQRAIEAPRFLVGRDPSDGASRRARVQIEDRFPRGVVDDLTARGHVLQAIGRKGEFRYGYAALAVIGADGTVHAGAEPRRSHAAVAIAQ